MLALMFVCAVGWFAAWGVRRERRLALMLVHQVERSAGPEERVVVDKRWLGWCLRGLVSMEIHRRIVFSEYPEKGTSLLSDGISEGDEFVFVTTKDDSLLGTMRSRGWVVRAASLSRPSFGVGSGDVEVFFVVWR